MKRPLLPLALLGLSLAACSGGGASPERPNILLITLDTTRADHLGCYGYERPTSPELDALARESVVFENAYAVSSWTMPAHASLFTGKFPASHGAQYDPDGVLNLTQGIGGNFGHYRAQPIADDEVTLAQILSRAGWATGGVAGGPWMMKPFRLDRGFDFYDDDNITEVNGRSAEDITRVARDFVDRHTKRPFFLFLNYYDPHGPYKPASMDYVRDILRPGENPAEMTQVEQMNALYDAEIRYMDEHLGVLLDHLRATGRYENTWIIVTADHGELLGEELFGGDPMQGHGHSLTEPEIRIPLLVKYPGANPPAGRETRRVQQTDVLPTILKRLGLPLPPKVQGIPFEVDGRLPTLAEVRPLQAVDRGDRDWRQSGDWLVILDGRYKFGWNSNGRHYLVDLESDPGETRNLVTEDPARAAELEERIQKVLRALPPPGTATEGDVDADVLSKLKEQGYIGDDEDG